VYNSLSLEQGGSYQGMDEFSHTETDVVTVAFANWKHYQQPITLSGIDTEVKNQGESKIFDMIEFAEKNALNTMQTRLNQHFYLDGTGNSSKNVTGLGAIISETPTTGILFGINRATAGNEYWRNQSVDTNGTAWSTTPAVSPMRNDMTKLYVQCGRIKSGAVGDRYPDLILSTETYFEMYDQVCSKIGQRFVNTKVADAGFTNLTFKGATMIHDEDCPQDAGSAEKAFFINSAFMTLNYAPKRNFNLSDQTHLWFQDGSVNNLFWSGELTADLCAKHGVHQGISATFAS
jgi:hypothetical protein